MLGVLAVRPDPNTHGLSLPQPVVSRLRDLGYDCPARASLQGGSLDITPRNRERDGIAILVHWPGSPSEVGKARRWYWSMMQGIRPAPTDDATFSRLPLGGTSVNNSFAHLVVFGSTTTVQVRLSRRRVNGVLAASRADYTVVEELARWVSAWGETFNPKVSSVPRPISTSRGVRTLLVGNGIAATPLADIARTKNLRWRVENGVASIGSTLLPLGAHRMKVGTKWVPTGGPIACLGDGTVLIPQAAAKLVR